VKHDAFPLWLGCGVMDEEDEEMKSAPRQAADPGREVMFTIFVTAEPGFFKQLFKRVDPKPAVQRVVEGMRRLIETTPEIREVEWMT
jgi:hypothetical protein